MTAILSALDGDIWWYLFECFAVGVAVCVLWKLGNPKTFYKRVFGGYKSLPPSEWDSGLFKCKLPETWPTGMGETTEFVRKTIVYQMVRDKHTRHLFMKIQREGDPFPIYHLYAGGYNVNDLDKFPLEDCLGLDDKKETN